MDIYKDRVLIVDDDWASRDLFTEHLTAIGYSAVTAKDGEDAIDILADDPNFDLIVTDVMMPYMTGFDFTARVKKTVSMQKIPIIATSAYYDWEKIQNDQAIIADGFVPKPIQRDVLVSEIKRVRGK
jgi:CheY-like chemotaxis protein